MAEYCPTTVSLVEINPDILDSLNHLDVYRYGSHIGFLGSAFRPIGIINPVSGLLTGGSPTSSTNTAVSGGNVVATANPYDTLALSYQVVTRATLNRHVLTMSQSAAAGVQYTLSVQVYVTNDLENLPLATVYSLPSLTMGATSRVVTATSNIDIPVEIGDFILVVVEPDTNLSILPPQMWFQLVMK